MSDDSGARGRNEPQMTLGLIGVGTIAAALVEGLGGGDLLLSPRGAMIAEGLAQRLPGVRVAASNQAVVDGSGTVILAVRPQVVEEVVRDLRFRPGQKVISLVAATGIDALRGWTGLDLPVIRAVPLPFVAGRNGVTPVFPPDAETEALFNRLGRAIPCRTQEEFDLIAVASALMGSYFGLLETAQSWLAAQGLPETTAHAYLAGLFASLGRVAVESGQDFAVLRGEYSTRGGLNEQLFRDFSQGGGVSALEVAMDGLLARVRG